MNHSSAEFVHGGLSHFDSNGAAHMVDVGDKAHTKRVAIAQGCIFMQPQTMLLIKNGTVKKGDVIGTARLAAIMATKKTAELIPLCHPLSLSHVSVEFTLSEQTPSVQCRVHCETTGQTGVEMEALMGVQVGLLTIYDMCKAVDKSMTISQVCLLEKKGGKSGAYLR